MARKESTNGKLKRVVLVASEKGGVGKSVFSRSLIDHLRSTANVTVAAYDADGGVGALVRVLGTRDAGGRIEADQVPSEGVGFYNVRADGERNQLLDCIEGGDDLIVHDLAGGALADLTRIVDGGDGLDGLLGAFEEHGYRLTIAHVLSADIGSAQSVSRWIDLVGDRADHVAVRNLAFSDHPFWNGFRTTDGSTKGGKTKATLIEMGGVEIDLPKLPDGTFAKLDAENVRFSGANDAAVLTITERAHVSKFRRDFGTAIAPAGHFLGLK